MKNTAEQTGKTPKQATTLERGINLDVLGRAIIAQADERIRWHKRAAEGMTAELNAIPLKPGAPASGSEDWKQLSRRTDLQSKIDGHLLSVSTDTILRLLRVRQVKQPAVTLEEIRVLLEQGADEGVFEDAEHEMVTNVLNLDDRHVGAVLTPRSDVVFLDVRHALDVNRQKLRQDLHNVLPLCDGGLEQVLGFVRSTAVFEALLEGGTIDLRTLAEKPLFVPETMSLMTLLEQFKRTHLPVALVVDEFGGVEGLVSLTDVIGSIVGELPSTPGEEPSIVRREDGSWLLDGALDLDTVLRTLDAESLLSDHDRQHYHTLGGLAMLALGRVPRTGDLFKRGDYRFEIVDMDGNRVDRVLVSRSPEGSPRPSTPASER